MSKDYIDALKVELSGARTAQHKKEIQAELARLGEKIVKDVVEVAKADIKTEVARVAKTPSK
jgi:hypothetical protein